MEVKIFPGDIIMVRLGPGGVPLNWGDNLDEFHQNAVFAEVFEVTPTYISVRLIESGKHTVHIIFADEYKHLGFVNNAPNPLVYQTEPCDA